MASQRDWVSPPTFRPLPFRLRDAIDVEQFTGHQKLGVQYQPDDCSFPLETTTECLTGVGVSKTPTGGANWRGADPFAVYTWIDCGLVSLGRGLDAEAELKQRTLRAHQNNAQTVAERIFWTGGDFGTYQHLASDTPVTEGVGGSVINLQTSASTVTGTYDIVKAISLLEGQMAACYGGVPIIHVPRSVTAFLSDHHLVTKSGQVLKTDNGSIVVPAPGYPGTGPDGSEPDADTAWIYATGSVKMLQSEPVFMARDAAETLRRSNNATYLILEQWFMFLWDCCHFAVQVDLPNTTTIDA